MNAAKQAFFLFISLLLLAGAGLYFASSTPQFKLDKKALLSISDAFITHAYVRQYAPSGKLASSLRSPLIKHTPQDNKHWINQPYIQIIQENQPTWEIRANQAIALFGGKQVTFKNNVRIHQQKGEHNEDSIFTTEEITYFPKTKQAVTDKDVLFKQPGNQVQSRGMKANLETKHVQLLGQARGVYDPTHG